MKRSAAHQKRDEVLALFGHELKTPLTSLRVYLELVQQRVAQHDEPTAELYLARAKTELDRTCKLISDLQEFSSFKRKIKLHKEFFRIDLLVHEVIQDLQPVSIEHQLQDTISPPFERKICADRVRMSQVLINLINNAIHYSPYSNKIVIGIRNEGKSIVVFVQDFGIGISKRDQKRIFDPYFRVKDAQVQAQFSLGLGLHVAQEIISAHNGQLWVESRKGEGSTFFFRVPKR